MSITTAAGWHVLLFGATGAIGQAILTEYVKQGWAITAVSRQPMSSTPASTRWLTPDQLLSDDLTDNTCYNAVCWAQGANANDSLYAFDEAVHAAMYEANVLFILRSLSHLLAHNRLTSPAKLCVISSIWQELARPNKLSYCVSKAALKGLVLSAAADIAKDGHCINAILPGALDTPMTRANLTVEQIRNLETATPGGQLATPAAVAALVQFLTSPQCQGMTGQFVSVDQGFGHVRCF